MQRVEGIPLFDLFWLRRSLRDLPRGTHASVYLVPHTALAWSTAQLAIKPYKDFDKHISLVVHFEVVRT